VRKESSTSKNKKCIRRGRENGERGSSAFRTKTAQIGGEEVEKRKREGVDDTTAWGAL